MRWRAIARRALPGAMIAALTLTPGSGQAQQTNPETMYFVQGEKYPRGLKDFQAFGLSRAATRYSGWMMGDRNDPEGTTIAMKSVHVTGTRLQFTTLPRHGVTFAFDGRFRQKGDFQRFMGKDTVLVEGTVRKRRGGKTVARGTLRFIAGVGG